MTSTVTIPPKLFAWLDPIKNLPEDQLTELAAQTEVKQLDAGTLLFDANNEEDKNFYYVLIGEVELTTEDNKKVTIKAKTEPARHPLGSGPPYRMSAVATTPIKYIVVDSNLVETMLTWAQLADQEPEVVMSEEGIFTIDKGSWLKKMIKSPTFNNLPPANIEQLLDQLEPIKVPAGEIIIRQGDTGDYFYMIDQGCALVTRQTEEEEDESIELAELPEGTSFGEAALISDKPRNATVSMMSDGVLLRLSKADFLTLLTEPNVKWITYEDSLKIADKSIVWLDIRLPSEFNSEHIKDAVNIPVQQLHRRARDLDKNMSYICYCDNGKRSSAASFILKQYGIEAYVLQEGTHSLSPDQLVKPA